ncbi:anaphase-promoting complex subunit cdh1 isoform X2 [Condylostylus longicornis]|uniref:anaphase-promoting complex subunit cdh1 isoform X2 n=1 Tax=Condylostylus longicornis TaxID=2530218 RepID=UPI00244DA660|nr:anaphase-promoting complex subunit cdh1 isoform X2 [Condylostylus longicornis]
MQPQYYNLKRENFHKIRRQIRSNNSNNKNNNDSNIENNIKGNLNHHQHQVHNSLEEKEFSILLSSNEINQDISSVSTIETTTTTAIAAASNNNSNSTTTIKSIASLSNPFDYYSEITNDSLVTTSLPNLMTTSASSKNLQDKKNFTLSSTSAGGTKGTGYIIQNVTTSSRPTPPPPPPPTLPTNHFNHKHQVNLNNEKRPTIIIYPTVSPESIVIPIVSCILGFPILALMVICCLRRRAKIARERDRRRHYDMEGHAVSLITDRHELSVYVLNEVSAEVSHH